MEGVITRTIVIEDYKIINEWRKIYGEKYLPKISDLPDKGFGGVVLEKNGDLFGVCYIYLTNSTIGYLGDAVFNPNYKSKDKFELGQTLLDECVKRAGDLGCAYIWATSSSKGVLERCKKSGFHITHEDQTIIMKSTNNVR